MPRDVVSTARMWVETGDYNKAIDAYLNAGVDDMNNEVCA